MLHISNFVDFDSIPEEHRAAVEACVVNCIMGAHRDQTQKLNMYIFNPHGNVPLGELCKAMILTLLGQNVHSQLPLDPSSFKGNEIGHCAAPYIEKCRRIGVYKKDPETTHPNEDATPADMRDMISSASQFLIEEMNFPPLDQSKLQEIYKYGDSCGEFITRSALAYVLFSFSALVAEKIYHFCVTDVPEYYRFSAVDAEPFLRLYYPEDKVVALMQLISRQYCVSPDGFDVILKLLACKNSELKAHSCMSPTIDHYTSLQTLKCLTEKDAHLRLYNAAFLNDPSEGAFFHNSLKEFLDNRAQSDQSDRLAELIDHTSKSTAFYPNSAYIVSFSNLKGEDDHNSLPMWFQYADHCKGCAIKFHTYRFRGNVYNVAYGLDGLDSFFESFFEIFNSIWDSNPAKYTEDAIISIAADILNLVSYLYKNESYEHEQESRIILFSPPQNAKKEDAPRAGELLPRTYLEVPFSIDSVTFGPDVKYPERLAVAFASAGLTCPFRKSSIPFISK